MARKTLNPGSYSGEEPSQTDYAGEAPKTEVDSAARNRGKPAPQQGSGAVVGSGATTGGAENAEDFDNDPKGGGGKLPSRVEPERT